MSCPYCEIVAAIFALPTLLWLVSYLIPDFLASNSPPVNVREKYGAKWALVTGGGSGIGRALVEKLALQGLNVVVVSLPDKFLEETMASLEENFPKQEFRSVGANFSYGVDYMEDIVEATEDIDIQCIFNNAGYIVTGFFEGQPIERQINNIECNALAAVRITHHFTNELIKKQLKGCVMFTSSVSAYIPNPFACMYGATKAFVSQFAASLAPELKERGIDVISVHPSPVATRFYDNPTHKIDMLESAKNSAVSPESVIDDMLRGIGRQHWRDMGMMAKCVRIFTAPISYNAITSLFANFAKFLPDYQRHNKNRG